MKLHTKKRFAASYRNLICSFLSPSNAHTNTEAIEAMQNVKLTNSWDYELHSVVPGLGPSHYPFMVVSEEMCFYSDKAK